MSGGFNHRPSCGCRFCYHPRFKESKPINFKKATVTSFTNPNALCPVCSKTVFYYRSPYDGRVFFDRLGKPWLKHPCTDNNKRVRRFIDSENQLELGFAKWKEGGWKPIVFITFGDSNANGVRYLEVRDLLEGRTLYLDAEKIPNEVQSDPALIRHIKNDEWEIDTPRGIYKAKERTQRGKK